MSDFHYLAVGRQQTHAATLPMATQRNSTTRNAPTQDTDTAHRGDDQARQERTQHPKLATLKAQNSRHRPNPTPPTPERSPPSRGYFLFSPNGRHRPLAAADQAKRKGKAKPRRTATKPKETGASNPTKPRDRPSPCTADKRHRNDPTRQTPTNRPANHQRRTFSTDPPPPRNATHPMAKYLSSSGGGRSSFLRHPATQWEA